MMVFLRVVVVVSLFVPCAYGMMPWGKEFKKVEEFKRRLGEVKVRIPFLQQTDVFENDETGTHDNFSDIGVRSVSDEFILKKKVESLLKQSSRERKGIINKIDCLNEQEKRSFAKEYAQFTQEALVDVVCGEWASDVKKIQLDPVFINIKRMLKLNPSCNQSDEELNKAAFVIYSVFGRLEKTQKVGLLNGI